jgi:stage II sporulation protein P
MYYRLRYFFYRNRFKLKAFCYSTVLVFIVILICFFIYYIPVGGILTKYTGSRTFSLFDIAVSWGERDPHGLMRSSVPVMAWAGDPENYPEEITVRSLITSVLAPFRININSYPELLNTEMPALAEYNKNKAMPGVPSNPAIKQPVPSEVELTPDALVGIYFTHTGETYNLTDGVDRVDGKQGGVVDAGIACKEQLEKKYGIRVALDDRINDAEYGVSYVESEKTARQILENNPKIQVILDIHRDAGKERKNSLVKINGRDIAPILFVVGSDARAPFPTWRKNFDFATKLSEDINKKYPGLCAGVRVKEGRYNQFLHPRALLVELGSTNNTTQEAIESAKLLADVLAETIAGLVPLEKEKEKRDVNSQSGVTLQ